MRTTVYVGTTKERMWEIGEGIGLAGEALLCFRHALNEVAVEIEVDPKSGLATIVAVEGRRLEGRWPRTS